ncbi:hypothetical protein [Arthrobacter sp. SD76]|uniref:hypothetical protein n=1 Tax=Arthrobacter sp. SD76 TaxID=3415007 RepID=UPI003C7846C6
MDQPTMQLLTAAAGFAATLGAVFITQRYNRLSESARRSYEAESRWHDENYRVSAAIVTKAAAIERKLYNAAALLDDEEREPRMPGIKSVLLAPEGGIEGVIDELKREILVEAVEEGFAAVEELENLMGELAIIGSHAQEAACRRLTDELIEAVGTLEMFSRASDCYAQIAALVDARFAFADASRDNLVSFQDTKSPAKKSEGGGG